jgi:large subunit ribosomal protein L15
MDLSTLELAPGARKNRKRLGRGPSSGQGKTAGKGHKGQKARSGYSRRRGFEGGQMPLSRRVPKRGFHHRKRFPYAVVNVDVLESIFDAGTVVTPELLFETGLIEPSKGGVKILGRGELATKLTVRANEVSPTARAKIEAAGGTVEILALPESATKQQEDN